MTEVESHEALNVWFADAKRQRLSAMRVGEETLEHVDVTADEYFQQWEDCADEYPKELLDDMDTGWDYDNSERELCEDDLWQPFTALEPQLDAETLEKIDAYADQVEIDRLLQMGVITTHDKFSADLGSQLSAKFVRSWRKKSRHISPGWLRRSRLVARVQLA